MWVRPLAEISAIVLAAGMSRRMGARNKLLLPVGGIPMIRHVIEAYACVTKTPVIVVTGHDAALVEGALEGLAVRIVFNPDFADGQPTSVTTGLRAAPEGHDLFIGLGDQPLLRSEDLETLLHAHVVADPARISIPQFNDQRGNPILVPSALRPGLLADPRAPGCKSFTRTHPDHVQFHALTAPGFYSDIDTPEAYADLERTR